MTNHYTEECKTSGGLYDKAVCKFPFIYKNAIFSKCTNVPHDDHDENTYWCATQINSTYHYQDKKWGKCSSKCPREGKFLKVVH